jgi:hypothetical protein
MWFPHIDLDFVFVLERRSEVTDNEYMITIEELNKVLKQAKNRKSSA